MHDALDRAERIVGDRIGAFFRLLLKLARVRHELPRNRIVRIVAIDQIGYRRGDGDGIARGDVGWRIEPVARQERLRA